MNYEKSEGVGILTFDNPNVLNALSKEVLLEIQCFVAESCQDKDLKVLIITGAGKAFVAGANIKQMQSMSPVEAKELSALGNSVMNSIKDFPTPVIAAVNGFALGGGVEMVLSADFAYASTKAKLGLPEVSLGLIPGFGGNKKLADRIGGAAAKELVYTGRMIGANEALRLGIVNRVVEPEALMDTVKAVAAEILRVSPNAVREAKEIQNLCNDNDMGTVNSIEINKFGLIFSHKDAVEGKNAFVEKRIAEWE